MPTDIVELHQLEQPGLQLSASAMEPMGIERTPGGRLVVYGYIALVAVSGAAMATIAVVAGPPLELAPVLLFCLSAGVTEWLKVAVADESPVAVSLSLSVIVAAMVTFGIGAATLA